MSEDAPASSRGAFLYDLATARLRGRCVWGGLVLLASFVLPYEVVDGQPQFLWSLFAELPAASVAAALAPSAAGLALVVLGLRTKQGEGLVAKRASSVALGALASLAALVVALKIGSDAADWDLLPLPESFVERPIPPLLALSLTAAGAALAFRPAARRVANAYLLAAPAAVVAFYAWPSRGEAPGRTLARSLALFAQLPGARLKIGLAVVVVLALWPALVAVAGLVHVRRPPHRDQPPLTLVAVFGLPALLLMLVYQIALGFGVGPAVFAAVGAVLVLASGTAVAAAALEVLGDPQTLADRRGSVGLRPRAAAAIAVATVVVIGGAQLSLARPPVKGIAWEIGPRSPEADRLFGELVPAWDAARQMWDRRVRSESGATTLVEAKARARTMIEAARALPGASSVAASLEMLNAESSDLDLAGRRWVHLVRDVNDANRQAHLPYYLDPNVRIEETPNGLLRHFVVQVYAVDAVHPWEVDDRAFATLLVEGLGPAHGAHLRLGFSRDMDPFALVLTDEVDAYKADLEKGTLCANVDGTVTYARCRDVLARVRDRLGASLRDAVLAETERHELQHQIDGPHLPVSSKVVDLLAGYAKESQDRANRELSAYVAQITTADAPGVLALVHLFPFGTMHSGGAEHRVALLVFEALSGRKLHDRESVDRAGMEDALDALAALPDDELRSRAARAYEGFFGQRLPSVRRR